MPKKFVGPALFGLWCLVLLLWQVSATVCAQVQSQGSSVSAPKSILLIYSYGDGLPAYQQATRAFLSTMEEGIKEGVVSEKSLYFEYLDLERKKDGEHYNNLTTLLLHKYATQKIDLIVTVHGPALKFILNEGRDLSPGTPVLSYLGPDSIETTGIGRRFLLLPMGMDFRGTLQLAQKLFPQTMRVVFVNGIGEGEKRLEREAKSVFEQWPDKLEFEYTSDLTVEEMLQRVATLPAGTIVIYSNLFTDKTGRHFVAREMGEMVAKAANVPVFGMYNTLLGRGIIGGSVFNFEAEGTRAGMLALDILRGKLPLLKPTTILTVNRTAMFDWQQLKRWGVNISRLPEGSIIVNRRRTVWSQYKEFVMAAIGLCLAQSLLIGGMLLQRRRKRSAEESLRQKTEELDRFFNVSLDLLGIANTEGYFLRLNPAWERILGYTREELMAKPFFDFFHPDDLERTRKAVSALVSEHKLIHFENRYRAKDGTYRWLEWTSAPAGNLIYAAARDLTERLKEEAEGQQRREELAHMTRIAMMGELTTSLAHEINQPLTAILSNAGAAQRFLSQAAPDIGEVRQILDDIIRDDRRASEVVRRVRALVKKEKVRHEPLDLNEMIQQVVDLIRGDSLLQGLSIRTDLSSGLATIHGDSIQLQQVILNLILNGAAAMRNNPPGQRKIIVRTAMADGGSAKAFVTDFGTGIDEHHIARLFEPFYTTKPEGLGMGLSISQTIIKAHGGAMEAWNNREGGATFAFTLPAHQGDPS
jgi:PAS domain S-box-containing protein